MIDKTQSVVKDVFSSDFIDLDDKTLQNVITQLNYENKRYKNILELYKYYQNVIFGMVLKDILGYYPEKVFEATFIKTAIKELEELKTELNQLSDEEKNLIGMNDKMEVHTKRTKIIEQQEKIKLRFTEDE